MASLEQGNLHPDSRLLTISTEELCFGSPTRKQVCGQFTLANYHFSERAMTLQWMHFRKAKHILQSPVLRVQARANASFLSAFSDINSSIANSAVLQFTKDSLISFHEWSHLPWFAEIALVTIAARCLIAFPLTVNQRRIITRYEALTPEILAISKHLQAKVRDEAYLVGRSKKGTNAVYRREVSTL